MICNMCKQDLDSAHFWENKEDKMESICKDCMLAKYNLVSFNPKLSPEIFEHFDIPIILDIWYSYCAKSLTVTELFGKYLGRMKLGNLKPLTYADTERLELKEEQDRKIILKRMEQSN